MTAEILAELRPLLHRYCARMMGSVADGEDVVQDTLARALAKLGTPQAPTTPPELRRWLFRVAHNRAIALVRGAAIREAAPIDDGHETGAPGAADLLAEADAVRAALARFLELPPVPRSCLILKDVLGHSLEEIAVDTDLSIAAVKAALHRGRAKLRELGDAASVEPAAGEPSLVLARYAQLFNARDWDGVRAMLADDVALDVATRIRRTGRRDVGIYFTNYAASFADPTRRVVPVWLDGREVLAAYRGDRIEHVIAITIAGEHVAAIRDFFHLPYITRDARFAS